MGVPLGGAKSDYRPADWFVYLKKGGAISAAGYMLCQSHTIMLHLMSYCIFLLHQKTAIIFFINVLLVECYAYTYYSKFAVFYNFKKHL